MVQYYSVVKIIQLTVISEQRSKEE